jgi:hypothetical protein
METIAKQRFIRGYTKILTQSWSSDEFSRQLESDPRAVLASMGLDTAPGSVVEIVRSHIDLPDLEKQLSTWAEGLVTGHFVLFVPHLPQLDTRDLDEEDLGDLAGGVPSFCCSPCCCQLA